MIFIIYTMYITEQIFKHEIQTITTKLKNEFVKKAGWIMKENLGILVEGSQHR